MTTGPRLALLLALFASGCVVGDATVPANEDLPPSGSEASLSNNGRTAFNFFVSKGLSDVQAAGVVGNLMQESSVIPTAVEFGGGPGRGIAQWSIGGRFNTGARSLSAYAASTGGSKWSLTTQLNFIWYELSTVGGFGLPELRAANTIGAAVYAFQAKYEVCGTCAQTKRLQYANQALADYGHGAGGSTGGGTGTGTGTGGTGGTGTGGTGTGTGGTTTTPPGATCYSGTLGRDVPENSCVESTFDGSWYQCSGGSWVDRWSDPDACSGEFPL